MMKINQLLNIEAQELIQEYIDEANNILVTFNNIESKISEAYNYYIYILFANVPFRTIKIFISRYKLNRIENKRNTILGIFAKMVKEIREIEILKSNNEINIIIDRLYNENVTDVVTIKKLITYLQEAKNKYDH